MSERTAKPSKSRTKSGKDDAGVLGNLPATRTTRVGGERGKAKTAARPKPRAAASATPKPKAAAKARAVTPAREPAKPHRPRPVRAGAPALAESTDRARSEPSAARQRGASPPTGTELVTTAIQAAGELAQIGLTVGGQVLRRAVGKLPKP
jgi:hypothetical protein